jgi:hypothetical protein
LAFNFISFFHLVSFQERNPIKLNFERKNHLLHSP